MIIKKILTNATSTFGIDENSATVEWLAFSDTLLDFGRQIAYQGIAAAMIDENGKANGWLQPGTPYVLGNDYNPYMLAGSIDVTDRQIIRGNGDGNFNINGNAITLTYPTPTDVIVAWKVTQKFSTKNPKNLQNQEPAATDPFTFSIDTEYEDEPFLRDVIDDTPVQNSAGVPFNPPPSMRVARTAFTITRRERMNPLAKIKMFRNTVNSEPHYGAETGTLLMQEIKANIAGGDELWTVTYKFIENENTWTTWLLDCGYEERIDGGLKKITMEDQTPPTDPIKLNGEGQKLDGDDAVDLPFKKYRTANFNLLNLPNLGNY